MNSKLLHQVSYVLLWTGGLNWGLWGLFNYNLVNALFGGWPTLEKLVYVLVGAAALYTLSTHKDYCRVCDEGKGKKK
jgi:uncharacterized membrane protein YuzA (DUF378 family)